MIHFENLHQFRILHQVVAHVHDVGPMKIIMVLELLDVTLLNLVQEFLKFGFFNNAIAKVATQQTQIVDGLVRH